MAVSLLDRIRVVHEDDSIVVVDKPAGLLTVATEKERIKTLFSALRMHANTRKPPQKIFVVHRLDREASGLLVFAKTLEVKEYLQNQFKDHSAGRRYVAVVEGRVARDQFTVKSYLAENRALRVYSTRKISEGKLAITHISVLKRSPKATLIEVRLETGRKHQIRVHVAESGHPIVGDKSYGNGGNPIRRLALHGAHLEFRHPRTRQMVQYDSGVPKDFASL